MGEGNGGNSSVLIIADRCLKLRVRRVSMVSVQAKAVGELRRIAEWH